jgi:hypothetical protein
MMPKGPWFSSSPLFGISIDIVCPARYHRRVLPIFRRDCASYLRLLSFVIMVSMRHSIQVIIIEINIHVVK